MEWILTGEDLTTEDSFVPIPTCDDTPLKPEEADLIAMYRLLPDYKQEDVFDIVHTLYQRHVERKKESIYWTYKADRLKRESTTVDDGSQGGIA